MYRRTISLIVIGILVLIAPFAVSENLRNTVTNLTSPISSTARELSTNARQTYETISSLGDLRDQKNALQQEVVNLQQQLSDSDAIKRENESLRKELNVSQKTASLAKVFAPIAVSGLNPLDPVFTITAGRNQGIKEGQPALYQGSLIGRVVTVRENTSVVRSIFSPKSVIQVWIPSIQENGVLIGDGNTVRLEDITQGVAVASGSLLETNGLGGTLPAGILIGTVAEKTSLDSSNAQSFRVNLANDPRIAESVIVLLTNQE
jgi:rod shape-determining protein MreC